MRRTLTLWAARKCIDLGCWFQRQGLLLHLSAWRHLDPRKAGDWDDFAEKSRRYHLG